MDKFLKRKSECLGSTPSTSNCSKDQSKKIEKHVSRVNVDELKADPGLRPPISDFHPNDQEIVRRHYLQKGPYQPRNHSFPHSDFSKVPRRFNPNWFDKYPAWLEYSIDKDAAFCLYCYLFGESRGQDAFVAKGFRNWKKYERFDVHVGGVDSSHNKAYQMGQDLLNQQQHIRTFIKKQEEQEKLEYLTRLEASIECIRYLLNQGLPFRGRDESEGSNNQGNFLELLQWLAHKNADVRQVVLKNAPQNNIVIAPSIQRDIINSFALEIVASIINDLEDGFFSILVDESRDISIKEQLVVAIRYVDKRGCVMERIIGFIHVKETTAIALKKAIEELFSKHGLSLQRLRGQGYDGASNMQGEFNGLKTLILNENEYAHYIHCFAHRLQLTLVAISQNHKQISNFFDLLSTIMNVVGASCKRRDNLREQQLSIITKAVESGDLATGKGLNQETSLRRPCDTRWGSHYSTLQSFLTMFSAVIQVLQIIDEDAREPQLRAKANSLIYLMQSFEFVVTLHIMKKILGVTNDLSKALQRKDQDIVNAMALVKSSRETLQELRNNGWDSIMTEISIFCNEHDIDVPSMDDKYIGLGRPRRGEQITNLHYYRVDLFFTAIDMQLQELNSRFTEESTELLLCIACLDPKDSFSAYDKQRLLSFAQSYPREFSTMDISRLHDQLDVYIVDMRLDSEFSNLIGISNLAKKMVEKKKNLQFPLVYLLLKLALTLPVATATVERAFSAMNIVKNKLRNRMGDDLMSDSLITYIENDIFKEIGNEKIIERFQNMKSRRGQLPSNWRQLIFWR